MTDADHERTRRREHTDFLLRHRMVEVDRTIAPDDAMVHGSLESYLLAGLSALHWVDVALLAAERQREDVRRVLDFPCGHGRVARALRAAFPAAELVACDIDADGVAFCASQFGATPVVGDPDPAQIALPGDCDLIWVGSLFTHLPAVAWPGFLGRCRQALRRRGVLCFTVAGPHVADCVRDGEDGGLGAEGAAAMLASFDRDGFGFAPYAGARSAPESKDQDYGRALAQPAWVMAQMAAWPELRSVLYASRGWDVRQDVAAFVLD